MPGNRSPSDRPVWLAIIFIMAVLIGAGSAFLLFIAKANLTDILASAGAAFVATMTLGMAICVFLSNDQTRPR